MMIMINIVKLMIPFIMRNLVGTLNYNNNISLLIKLELLSIQLWTQKARVGINGVEICGIVK